jgi:methionine-gamma-lyase
MSDKIDEKSYSLSTRLIHDKAFSERWDFSHHVIPPITTSSTFRLSSVKRGAQGFMDFCQNPLTEHAPPIYVYDRLGEPNVDMLQDALATAEEGEIAVVFSSGMAAISASVLFSLTPGAHIISHTTIYGCTYNLFAHWLPKMGYKVSFANLQDPEILARVVTDETRVLYLESPANPTLELLDTRRITDSLAAINAQRPDDRKIISIFDNTFATPFCQRPLKDGVDVVVHSLTKGICGFGTEMGGAIITRKEFYEPLIVFRKDFGGILSPQTAWHIQVYGLSTLALRIKHQQSSARRIAKYLSAHPKIEKVHYPGLPSFPQYEIAQRTMRDYNGDFAPGIIVYFTIKGATPHDALQKGEKIMNYIAEKSYAITLAVSLGQLRSLIEHPGSMTHAAIPADEQLKAGIEPGGIRLAVGAEDPDDIMRDLGEALNTL